MTDYDWEMVGLSRARRPEPGTIFDAADFARVLKVHPRTVQRWILAGKLHAHRKGNVRSRWRVSLDDVKRAWWEAAGVKEHKHISVAMIRAALRARSLLAEQASTTLDNDVRAGANPNEEALQAQR